MNIGIDIDDTLTDTFAYFQPFVAEYFGGDLEELRRKEISYINLPEAWQERYDEFAKFYFDRVVPDIPFKEDSAWGVDRLRSMGHRIIIITARTTMYYTDPYHTARLGLSKGNIHYDNLICTRDKGRACAEEHIDIFIDDVIHNCLRAAEAGASPIVFNTSVNAQEKTDFPRANSWAEIVSMIEKMDR